MSEREATGEVDRAEIRRLIKELGSKVAGRRCEASMRLRRLWPGALELLLEAARRERRRTFCRMWLRLGLGVLMATFVYASLRQHHVVTGLQAAAYAIMLLAEPLVGGYATRRYAEIAGLLREVEDVRCLGSLAEALSFKLSLDHSTRGAIMDGVLNLLPRVKESDVHALTLSQRESVCRLLTLPKEDLVIATLRALEQIGDAKALPYLDRIRSKNPEVIAAAESCREYLLTRAELDEKSRTLLRPAEDSGDGRLLLRPAWTPVERSDARLLLPAGIDGIEES